MVIVRQGEPQLSSAAVPATHYGLDSPYMHLAAPESRPQSVKLNQHWQRIDKQMTTSLYTK